MALRNRLFELAESFGLTELDSIDRDRIVVHCPHPSHEDAHPSCLVWSDGFKCYGCGEHGGSLRFVTLALEKVTGECDELEALKLLVSDEDVQEDRIQSVVSYAQRISPKRIERARSSAHLFFQRIPQIEWSRVKGHYLQRRGFSNEILSRYDVRVNSASRFPYVFPIYAQYQFRGYIARSNQEQRWPKYWLNPGFSKDIVGCPNEQVYAGQLMLVEGWLDALKAVQFGCENVGCLFGWYCTDGQAEVIRHVATEIICALDNDEAGEMGFHRMQMLFPDIPVRRMKSTMYKDPCDFVTRASFVSAWQNAK